MAETSDEEEERTVVTSTGREAAYDEIGAEAVESDVDADTEADADALLEGVWSTAARPLRTNAMEPWPTATTCIGASILAFAADPQHDRVYFWLGKERKVLAWGAGSNRWSDFGGGRARGDADPAATAAREFVQETAGCVQYFEADGTGLRTRWDDIATSLRRGEYVIKLETAFVAPTAPAFVASTVGTAGTAATAGTTAGAMEAMGAGATETGSPDPIRLFVTYVVQVPWDPRAIMRFQHCRALLSGLHKQLLRVPLEAAEEEALRPGDATLRASRERWVLYHPAVRQRSRLVPRALAFNSRPPLSSPDDEEAGALERIPVIDSVNLDYLEKESLELWSVPQLRRALQYDGILSNRDGSVESLRPGFVTVLIEAFDELGVRHPMHFAETPAYTYPTVSF